MPLLIPFSLVKLLSSIPVRVYPNAKVSKLEILSFNKKKAGIYLWTHKESNKKYVGSAFDLSRRLRAHYSLSNLEQVNHYISRALLRHTHSAFSLSILQYIDVSNLSKKEARILILSREQYYIDLIQPKYNILKVAGSSLGYKHTEQSLAKITGENHHLFGKNHTFSTITKLSGENNHMFGRKGELHPMYGKSPSIETRTKSRITQGTAIFVFTLDGTLINTFSSAREAGEFLNCSHTTVVRYVRNKNLFKGKWILSSSSSRPVSDFLEDL